jgi:hypothetical protein
MFPGMPVGQSVLIEGIAVITDFLFVKRSHNVGGVHHAVDEILMASRCHAHFTSWMLR